MQIDAEQYENSVQIKSSEDNEHSYPDSGVAEQLG